MNKSIVALIHTGNTKSSFSHVIREAVPNARLTITKTPEQLVDECFKGPKKVGTVFIEHGFPLPKLIECLGALRKSKDSRPEKIILLIGEGSAKENILAEHLSIGFSGILSMPFSESSLNEVLKVSEELSMQGSFARLKVVTGLQIKSMFEKRGERFEGDNVLAAVRHACQRFEEENPGKTVEEITQEYTLMDPKERLAKGAKDLYQGASERVRKIVEERDRKESQKESEENAGPPDFVEEKSNES